MFPKEFSIVLFIGLLIIGIYLLMVGKLNQYALSAFLLVSFFVTIGFYHIDDIKKIQAISKYMKILVDIEKVQKEIYAKAETVQELGENIAEVGAFTIARQERWASGDETEKLVDNRNKLAAMLKKLGTSEKDIERILSEPDKMVCFDLFSPILKMTYTVYNKLRQSGIEPSIDYKSISSRLIQMRNNRNESKEICAYLHETGLLTEELKKTVNDSGDKCDYYRKYKKLKLD